MKSKAMHGLPLRCLQRRLISSLFYYIERVSLTSAAYFYRPMLRTPLSIPRWRFYHGSGLEVLLNVSTYRKTTNRFFHSPSITSARSTTAYLNWFPPCLTCHKSTENKLFQTVLQNPSTVTRRISVKTTLARRSLKIIMICFYRVLQSNNF